MSSARIADNSQQWVKRLKMTPKMLTGFYKGNGARWHDEFAVSREVFDFFTAGAVSDVNSDSRDSYDDGHVFGNWERILCKKLGAELGENSIVGARAMGWLAVDFACWASRLPDDAMSEAGASRLGRMMSTGSTHLIGIPETSDMYAGIQYVNNQVVLDDGSYDDRFIMAWGDGDMRLLDFYRTGIVNRSLIERCIADGVDAELARSLQH